MKKIKQELYKTFESNPNDKDLIFIISILNRIEDKIFLARPPKRIFIAKTKFVCLECERLGFFNIVNHPSTDELHAHIVEFHTKIKPYGPQFKCCYGNCKSHPFENLEELSEHVNQLHVPPQTPSFLSNHLPNTCSPLRICFYSQ